MPKPAKKQLCPLDFMALRNKHAYNVEKIIAKTTMIAGYEDTLERGTSEAESMLINHRVTNEMYKLESEMPEFSTAGFLLPLHDDTARLSWLSTATATTAFSDAASSFTALESKMVACRNPSSKRRHKTCVRSEADTCHQSLQQAIRAGKSDGMLLGMSYLSRLAPRVDANGLNIVVKPQPNPEDIKGSRKRSADPDSGTSSAVKTVRVTEAETSIRRQPRCGVKEAENPTRSQPRRRCVNDTCKNGLKIVVESQPNREDIEGSRKRSADPDSGTSSAAKTIRVTEAEIPIRRQAENPTRSQQPRRCVNDTYKKIQEYNMWLDQAR